MVMHYPLAPVGVKPQPYQFLGPASVPGGWWKNMRMCIPMWEGIGGAGGHDLKEIVSGATAVQAFSGQAAPTWPSSPFGHSYGWATADDGGKWTGLEPGENWGYTGDGDNQGPNKLTVALFLAAHSTDSSLANVFSKFEHYSLDWQSWTFTPGGTNNAMKFRVRVGNTHYTTAKESGIPSAGDLRLYMGTYDGDTGDLALHSYHWGTLGAPGLGQRQTISGNIGTTGAIDWRGDGAGFPALGFGRLASAIGRSWQGPYFVAYGWDRVLPAHERDALAEDPFAPLRSQGIMFTSSVAVGGSLPIFRYPHHNLVR